jgi:Flp pilus assembly protein TadG
VIYKIYSRWEYEMCVHKYSNGLYKGQSLVEVAIIMPLLLLMLLGVFEVGLALRNYLKLVDANREVVRWAVRPHEFTIEDLEERIETASFPLKPETRVYHITATTSTFTVTEIYSATFPTRVLTETIGSELITKTVEATTRLNGKPFVVREQDEIVIVETYLRYEPLFWFTTTLYTQGVMRRLPQRDL